MRLLLNCTKGDPATTSMAVATALQNVLATQMMGHSTPGDPRTTCATADSESKMTREAVLEGLTVGKGPSDWEKDTGMLYKRDKLLPPFPGSRCRTEPDLWEDW